ncbi:MAG: hypothetical protein EA384_11615 [Spirochaetaceae bacterium]|nr:MAG: hypothetical protein EA384_11615 [Spirochaetaceae bacterium]
MKTYNRTNTARVTVVLLLLLLLIPMTVRAQTFRAVLQSAQGRVEVRLPGQQWQSAIQGMEIPVNAEISTSFGAEAVLALGEAAVLHVRPLTRMRLEQLIERENSIESDMFLQVGRVRGEVRGVQGLQSDFRLRSTQATAAVRGTDFDFDGTNLRVLAGLVRIANLYGRQVSVGGNEESTADPTSPPSNPLAERIRRSLVSSTTEGSGAEGEGSSGITTIAEERRPLIINVTF